MVNEIWNVGKGQGNDDSVYLPAHVNPTTEQNIRPADPPTAHRKKYLNSALVRKDWTYFMTVYAMSSANTPGKKNI